MLKCAAHSFQVVVVLVFFLVYGVILQNVQTPRLRWDQTNYWTESGCVLPASHTVINIKAIKRVFNLPPPAVINEEGKAGEENRE